MIGEARSLSASLRTDVNKVRDNPELCYQEHITHNTLSSYLKQHGFSVTRKSYGIDTSFEYDALPGAKAPVDLKVAGRIRILGTPAEEGGGGKVEIDSQPEVASRVRGRPAHEASNPWNGINALDAAQIKPEERIYGVFEDGGSAPNVRVKKCFKAGAMASGSPTYKDLQVNDTLSETYVEEMAALGERFMPPRNTLVGEQSPKAFGSTDMGIVSYEVPGLHSAFVVPTPSNVARHNPNFAAAAATDEAHSITIKCAKDLAMLAFRVLTDDKGAMGAKADFDEGLQLRIHNTNREDGSPNYILGCRANREPISNLGSR
ncbi:hypothetical protein NOF04DRAFT_1349754 [Fusarium oxysporum II5]|nr:hypothetical protein NOF04DRAFT_1349754 [Fusarium oxysporum II5]